MVNKEYTCDCCGIQFDAKTGYSLKLCPKEAARDFAKRDNAIGFDLCENCAEFIIDKVRNAEESCAK